MAGRVPKHEVAGRRRGARAKLRARAMLIGVCGALVVLGSVLVIPPAILKAVGLLSVA